jgi:DnaJ-class molecular chaperone
MKKECEYCNGQGKVIECCGEIVTNDYQICPECKEHCGEDDCEECNGSGEVEETFIDDDNMCSWCNGTGEGMTSDSTCQKCKGKGVETFKNDEI